MHLIYFIQFAFLMSILVAKKYTCVFDQLYKDYQPHQFKPQIQNQQESYLSHGRNLAVLSRTPIRITLDTSDFDTVKASQNGAPSTTTSHLFYIKRAMQVAQTFFQARLQVTQVSRIKSPANCFDFDTPSNDQTNGIASSDLHIYVRYLSDKLITYGATGVHCLVFSKALPDSTFQAGRPIVGRIVFNTYTLLSSYGISSDQALLTNRRFSSITATAIHQTIHILGFNSNLYATYINPASSDGSLYLTANLLSTSAKLHASRTKATVLLKTPAVTAWAQSFFSCPGITGMQLQNQDATTPGSHWQRAIMYDQIMTGTQLGAQKGISGATFALLKDMGWYDVNDRFYDYTNYGYQKGCTFYTDVCYGTTTGITSLPKYFCDPVAQSSVSQCSTDFLGKATCTSQATLMADGCGMWGEYHYCVDPDQGDDGFKQYTLQQYKTSSFCVKSTYGTSSVSEQSKSRCYPYVCTYAPDLLAIKFTVGTYTVNCLSTEPGATKTISALSGYLQCPNYNDFCVNSRKICPNWCSQNGFCTRGICNCYQGYSGEDCSITICTSSQYYNPKDKSCGATCPSGTYQNVYSKTCLPCTSPCSQCLNQPQLCTSCHSTVDNPQVFYNGICYDKCPTGTFQASGSDTCSICDSATAFCATCTGTLTTCTSCTGSKYLSGPTTGTCDTSCPSATYKLQDRVNFKCLDSCTNNLVLSSDGAIGICILCGVGQFKWVSDGACHADCASGFYKDSDARFCRQCHTSCLYCDGSYAQNCTQCKSASTNKYLLLKMCVSSCPAGYYPNDVSGACQVCTPTLNCATCYINATSLKELCSTCKYGYYLQTNNNTCLTGCDKYKYQNKWNHSCDSCHTSCGDCSSPYQSSCVNCQAGKYFLSNQTGGYCLGDCPTVYYVKTGINCLSCHRTCKTCNGVSSSSCATCIDGLYLYAGFCRYVCPEKTYPNKNSSKCDDCNSSCRFCFGVTVDNCTSCNTGLILNNYTCASSCPKGMIVNQWNVCQKSAPFLTISVLLFALAFIFLIN